MLPDAILKKFDRDRELALASGKERACGKKIRYGNSNMGSDSQAASISPDML